jgi:hypothetical protein
MLVAFLAQKTFRANAQIHRSVKNGQMPQQNRAVNSMKFLDKFTTAATMCAIFFAFNVDNNGIILTDLGV